MGQQRGFGDTTMTKVFAGGLAWETQKDVLREHFEQYGEILEAVVISDKLTGRSKGYGFVTFNEAEAAKSACEDTTPMINGRRANCNLASLGARRSSRSSPPPLPPQVQAQAQAQIIGRGVTSGTGAPQQHLAASDAVQLHHYYPGVVAYYAAAGAYGYSPSYMTDLGYTAKVANSGGGAAGGSYVQHGQYSSYPARGGMVAPDAMLPVHPMYHYRHHQAPRFFAPSTTASPAAIVPVPTVTPPTPTVEQVTGC